MTQPGLLGRVWLGEGIAHLRFRMMSAMPDSISVQLEAHCYSSDRTATRRYRRSAELAPSWPASKGLPEDLRTHRHPPNSAIGIEHRLQAWRIVAGGGWIIQLFSNMSSSRLRAREASNGLYAACVLGRTVDVRTGAARLQRRADTT